ncbi:hypothetical protein QEH59_12885 [Coraliomargarita sp. SDUM461004]|uniref:Fibronectin type-III domain-containing protein n=1 Tax=Thalassobacterium sedimentorum TaxID=3041258 RepID=A0ABU1AN92_9BACT|nr:hypothetical protein [Coraliomargarita sp. SDUM461004]MDQ8195325.1 hypothetical protein [Coraliomargarita sp. SDUM461004]
MFAIILRRLVCSLLLATVSAWPLASFAQDLEQLTFTLGTTGRDANGADFGYMVLQSQEAEAVIGRPYAIYEKAADFATAAPFQLRAVIQLQTDPRTIRSILKASEKVDEDFAMLEQRVDGYFEDVDISTLGATGGEPDLAEKVSIAVRSAQANPSLFEGLYFLGRLHPGINCVLGLAYFGELNQPLVTWELREWNPSSREPEDVVGRVLMDLSAASPSLGYPPLPAPGKPVDVPFPISETTYENDPRGHLNVRLRWHTPEDLRQQSLLAIGYNVYRLAKADAIGLGWVSEGDPVCPAPSVADARMLLEAGMLVQTNVYPIMPVTDLSEAESEDLSDSETFFTADDDDRFEPGAEDTFGDGDEFYYFAGAQDLLRRPGELSDGHYVKICDQKPPLPIDEVKVRNHFVASTNPAEIQAYGGEQQLEVQWRQLEFDGEEPLDNYKYYIYRWDSPQEILEKSANPLANLVAGPIDHDTSKEWRSWIDTSSPLNPDAPNMADDAGRTYFYTVRVEDNSACGGNMSANSASAYGVLRDRRPLEDPSGSITTRCLSLEIEGKGTELFQRNPDDLSAKPIIRIAVTRSNPDIEWASVNINFGKNTELDPIDLERRYFAEGENLVIFDYQPAAVRNEVRVNVHGGDRFGNISNTALLTLGDVNPNSAYYGVEYLYELSHIEILTDDRNCGPHIVVDTSAPGGLLAKPTLELFMPERAREYKLYRRINNGDLSLIQQGQTEDLFTDLADFEYADYALPNAPMYTICYFLQVFDEHGNASALVPVDECIEFIREYPAPLLAQPELYSGSNGQSMARLTWYCPPEAVDKFELWIASDDAVSPGDVGDALSELTEFGARHIQNDARTYYIYQTRRLATVFGQTAPEFSVDLELDPNKVYSFLVRAVSAEGLDSRLTGPFSNLQSIAWTQGGSDNGPNVAWPDRDLPGLLEENLEAMFTSEFGMEILRDDVNGPMPALRIGAYRLVDEELDEVIQYDKQANLDADFPTFLTPPGDPVAYTAHRIIERRAGQSDVTKSIFPFALYRYRVDAPLVREPSKNVEQVSPMMREIAYEGGVIYDIGKTGGDVIEVSRIRDPYVFAELVDTYSGNGPTHHLYMRDFTPVQFGGTYQYLMVFFTERGEIETVLPLNTITIQ